MNAWDDMVACAVQGTARRQIDPGQWPPPLGPMASRLTGDPAARLLQAACAGTILRRAGTGQPRVGVEIADLPPVAPPDARAPVGWLVDGLLRETPQLHRRLREPVVAHLISRVLAVGKRFPFESVPFLLETALAAEALREPVLAVIGPRGRWAAQQNPRWRPVLQPAAPLAAPVQEAERLPEVDIIRQGRLLLEAAVAPSPAGAHARTAGPAEAIRALAAIPHPWPSVLIKDVIPALPDLAWSGWYGRPMDLVTGLLLEEPVEKLFALPQSIHAKPDNSGFADSVSRVVQLRQTFEGEL